jgi:hypothetical protein
MINVLAYGCLPFVDGTSIAGEWAEGFVQDGYLGKEGKFVTIGGQYGW